MDDVGLLKEHWGGAAAGAGHVGEGEAMSGRVGGKKSVDAVTREKKVGGVEQGANRSRGEGRKVGGQQNRRCSMKF